MSPTTDYDLTHLDVPMTERMKAKIELAANTELRANEQLGTMEYVSPQDIVRRAIAAYLGTDEAGEDLKTYMTNAEMVREFHLATGLPVRDRPTASITEWKLRVDLISEEFKEYGEASLANDIIEIADALADLLYVVYGTAHAHGIPIDKVFREVHRSNMSKLGEDGKPITREDGKVLKGPNYSPPDIKGVLYATQ